MKREYSTARKDKHSGTWASGFENYEDRMMRLLAEYGDFR